MDTAKQFEEAISDNIHPSVVASMLQGRLDNSQDIKFEDIGHFQMAINAKVTVGTTHAASACLTIHKSKCIKFGEFINSFNDEPVENVEQLFDLYTSEKQK